MGTKGEKGEKGDGVGMSNMVQFVNQV